MFHVTYELDGVSHAVLVDTPYLVVAERIFWKKYPYAKMLGMEKATQDDMKPGKPVLSL